MNYFKAAEQLLASVPALMQAEENLHKRYDRLIQSGTPSAKLTINPEKYQTLAEANEEMSKFLDVILCRRQIEDTEKTVGEIYGVLYQLTKEQRKLLDMWYIEKLPKEEIMQKLSMGIKTLYAQRNTAVAEFALRYYGASALYSV